MKYILFYILFFLLLSFQEVDSIYNITIKSIDGNKIELAQFKGKKMLFVLLPLSSQDTVLSVREITSLRAKYKDSLVVIGIPPEESGYKKLDAQKVKNMYKGANTDIIIAEGMKVQKSAQQSALIHWLTDKKRNGHFDSSMEDVGSKYFVDEGGELYAVMGPKSRLTSELVDRIVRRSMRSKSQNNIK